MNGSATLLLSLAPVRADVNDIMRLQTESQRLFLMHRYQIAVRARAILRTQLPGFQIRHDWLADLAAVLHLDRRALEQDIAVADCWDVADFERLATRTDVNDHHLSWAHLVTLAGVADASRRTALVELTYQEGLTLHGLKKIIRTQRGRPAGARTGQPAVRR